MSKAAGPTLREELRKLKETTADMDEGDIVHTVGGNLCCRHVIHCVCCPWKGDTEQEEVRIRIFSCQLRSFYSQRRKTWLQF